MALTLCGGDAGHAFSALRLAVRSDGAGIGGEGDSDLPVHSRSAAADCPLCSVGGGHPPLMPMRFILPEAPRLTEGPPTRFFTAARPLFVWAAVRSRGPPSTA